MDGWKRLMKNLQLSLLLRSWVYEFCLLVVRAVASNSKFPSNGTLPRQRDLGLWTLPNFQPSQRSPEYSRFLQSGYKTRRQETLAEFDLEPISTV